MKISVSASWNSFRAILAIALFLFGCITNSSAGGSGSLVTGDTPAPASANLTATGTTDWIHWGLTSSTSVDRKAAVTPQISSFTTVGGTASRYSPSAGVRVDFTWSDGTPTASATTTTGVYLRGVGNRFELSVPADTVSKTLTLYAGGFKARGQLDFSLSDGSASPASIIIDNPNGVIDREVTVSFAAASAGQSLRITYTLLNDYGVGGNITLAAAALSGVTANQPPILATIGNKVVTAGQPLSFPVSATDPDGPLPLILAGAPLPGSATFTDNSDGSGQFDWVPSESDVAGSPYSVTFTATDGTGAFASASIEITVRSDATRPNIVLIMADDLGYGDLGSYGSSTIATPNLDQLASDGLRFTAFYAAPVCQMARAQLMTGSYSSRVGLSPGMIPRSSFGINSSEITISELLKTRGYATAIFGKWHLGDAPEFLPTQHGFDEFFGLPYSNDMWPFHPKICPTPDEDPRLTAARERAILTGYAGEDTPCWPTDIFPDLPLIAGNQIVDLNPDQSSLNAGYTQEALNFIQQNANRPFFLYLPYTAPHVPLFPDPAFLGSSQADLYGDTVQELDFYVGQILGELDNLGLANDTLVIFISDNGPWLEYGIDGGSAGPLRAGKSTNFEGGVRVPAIMKWPAEILPGSQSHAIASLLDIFPTVANSAGATIPQDRVIDGKDLTPVLRDPANSTGPRSTLYFFKEAPNHDVDQTLYLRAMRSDQWKLHLGVSGTTITANALYDLETDIGESNNLIASNSTIVQNLVAVAQTFNDTLRQNTRPVGIITPTGGSLLTGDTPAPASVDLTATGATDWIHWGLTSSTSVDRKAAVTPQISSFTTVGGSASRYSPSAGVRVDFTWSDGTPTASATTTTGVYLRGVGNRFELSVPADTVSKTLTLYAGGFKARGQLDFSLSDGSASPASIIIDNPNGVIDREVTVSFAAASAGQSLRITYTLLNDYGVGGNITLAAAALSESPIAAGTVLLEDDFNDGDTVGWTIVDNCPFSLPEWSVQANVLMQTNNCFGFSPEGIALGTHQLSASTLPNDIDIQVRLRSEDPLLDPVTSNDASDLKFGTIGMIFGYQDENNYYRFELNARNGHRKLWRVQAGTFTELVTSPQSYVGGQWINLRMIHQNGVILIFIDGIQVMAAADATYSSGKIAFFCAVNPSCSFDNLMVLTAPSDPMPGLNLPDSSSPAHASGEYFVTPGNILDVAGMTTMATGIGGMEFVLDEGTGSEVSRTDTTPPYVSQFSAFVPGEHTITAYLLDTSAVRLTSGTASATMTRVGVEGIHLFAMGDSITFGLLDDIAADDISIDTRNTGGGYAPVLNDYLNAYNDGSPVTVINDGNSGELTSTGAGRIGMVLARTPAVQAYLFGYGTNDSGGSMPLMSGLGMSPGDADYAGSYKDYLQQIIDAVVLPPPTGAGKLVFFAKIPPYLSNSTRDAKIQEYNQVIDELVAQLKDTYPSSYLNYTPPDFHSYFTANQVEMASDLIHPNGTGYQSMGRLWCEALNGLQGWFCLDDDKDGLLNSLEAQLGTDPFLVDTDGDGLVDGNDGFVPIGSIPWGVDTNGDGFADGEQVFATDPLLADSDGDRLDDGLEVANASDPLDANSWPALADGDIAPLGAPDGEINAGDILVATRIVLGLETATALELAHGDLYPPGAPDGMINLQDLILLRKMP